MSAAGGLIVYVAPYYPPFGAGGAERTSALHARLLADGGRRIVVVTPNFGAPEREEQDGIEVVRHAFGRLDAAGQQVPTRRFAAPRYQRRLAGEIVRAVAGRPVLCVHAQHQNAAVGAAAAARRLGVPFVGHVRDTGQICSIGALCLLEAGRETPPRHCGLVRNLACHQTRFAPTYLPDATPAARVIRLVPATAGYVDWTRRSAAYAHAARIAFASDGLRRLYATLSSYANGKRHRVVYAPVVPLDSAALRADLLPEPVRQAKAQGRPLLLYVGKASRGKGCDVMFAAWDRLAGEFPEARLVVAGNIDPGAWGIDPARTLTLGFVAPAAVPALYEAADLVLLPSTWPEPLGWATLDAARHGKPIVATRVGGVPEAVEDGVTGRLVERLDPAAMAAAIADILGTPDRGAALGEAARARIMSRFGPPAVKAQLDALYAGLETWGSAAT